MDPLLLIETIIVFFIAAICVLLALKMHLNQKFRTITSIFYLRLVNYFFAIIMLFGGFYFISDIEILSRLFGMMLFPLTISIVLAINYLMRETYYSLGLIIISCLGILYIYVGIQPDAINNIVYLRYAEISKIGLFGIMSIIFVGIICFYFLYWAIKTWNNAPFLIKKDATFLFCSIFIAIFGIIIFYCLSLLESFFFLFSEISLAISIVLLTFSIIREPKLLYILPFTVYRILVKDRKGYPLFDHDWAESNINEILFTGFLNSVQIMSEEVMKVGGLLDINLTEGILILNELDYITVGLVTSKSSGLLKDSLMKFSIDFENKFQRELKKSIKDKNAYVSAYELIEKYFSNFPYKDIGSRKERLSIVTKERDLTFAIDNKLKDIFKDENDYLSKKEELLKFPYGIKSSFLDLYKELEEEPDQTLEEDNK